jgi:hypothetical protein
MIPSTQASSPFSSLPSYPDRVVLHYSHTRTLLSFIIPIPGLYCPSLFPCPDIIVLHSSSTRAFIVLIIIPIWASLLILLLFYLGLLPSFTIHIRALLLLYYHLGTTAPYYPLFGIIILLIIHIQALLFLLPSPPNITTPLPWTIISIVSLVPDLGMLYLLRGHDRDLILHPCILDTLSTSCSTIYALQLIEANQCAIGTRRACVRQLSHLHTAFSTFMFSFHFTIRDS